MYYYHTSIHLTNSMTMALWGYQDVSHTLQIFVSSCPNFPWIGGVRKGPIDWWSEDGTHRLVE